MTEDLPKRIKYWLSEANHDCFFVVGPENGPTERIGALKHILMGDSEPFRAMLQDSELAEKGDIRVTDVDPKTFWDFLKCVYGGSSIIIQTLTFEECAKLLYITEKYLVNDIITELTVHMKKLFSIENIFVALSHPICYQASKSLEKEMFEILKFDFEEIAKNDNFLELSYSSIEWILQVKYLTVKEIEIWNALLRWAKHKTDSSDGKILHSYIFGLLKYIRFLAMNYCEFRKVVVSSEVLLEEEVNDICKAFVLGKPCSIEHLCNIRSNRYNKRLVSNNICSKFMENPKYILIQCSVNSVTDLPTCHHYSKTYHWAEHLWHVLVAKKNNKEEDTLGVWVGCNGKTSNWNCAVDIEISLINQTGKQDVSRNFDVTFSEPSLYQGCRFFYEWSALINPDNGFVKDDRIILMAWIQLMY